MKHLTGGGSEPNKRRIYQLGDVQIETDTLKVIRKGQSYSLEPRNMALLEYLIEHAGRVVKSDELIAAIWSNRPMGENPLYKSIAAIRKALGDDSQAPRYIETISKTGYCLRETPKLLAPPKKHRLSLTLLFGTGLLLGLVIILTIVRHPTPNEDSSSQPQAYSKLAILPFTSEQLPTSDEYLANGLTQALSHRISNLSKIRLISQGSLSQSKTAERDVQQLHHLLGIHYLLDGEILSDQQKIIVKAYLIDTSNQQKIWSEEFEGEPDEMLNLHPSIAEHIAQALTINLQQEERLALVKPDTINRQAYLAYMRGRYFWSKLQRAEVEKSLQEFRRAIDLDPAYALAWSGLADAYNFLAELNALAPKEAYAKARKAANMALSLDPELAEAHAAMAVILTNYDWNWGAALSHYDSAIRRDPSYVPAYQARAELLRDLGLMDDAMASIKIARQLDPLSPTPIFYQGTIHLLGRQNEQAIAIYLQLIAAYPEYPIAHFYLALAYSLTTEPELALPALDKVDPGGLFPDAVALRAYIYGKLGEHDRARQILTDLDQMAPNNYVSPFLKALVQVTLGNTEQALSLLEQGYQQRTWMMRLIKVVPHLDPLRNEPRFAALLEKMQLEL